MNDVILQTPGTPPRPPMAMSFTELDTESAAASLTPLIRAVSHGREEQAFVPPVPQTMEQIGVSETTIEELTLKTLYARGEIIGRDLAESMGVKFSLIEHTVEGLKRQRAVEVKGSLGF